MIPALTVGTWIELTLKATLVLACAGGVSVALRRASAATRHMVWAGALAAVLVMPAVWLLVPRIAVAVPMPGVATIAVDPAPQAAPAPQPPLPAPRLDAAAAPVRAFRQVATVVPQPSRPSVRLDPASGLLLLWAVVAAGLVLRLMLGLAATRRLVRRSHSITDGPWIAQLADASAAIDVRRPVRLAVSAGVDVPITCGSIHPAIVLPACALDWDAERARVVLLHELAHIRRRDCVVQWAAALGVALHWMNPLAWMAAARLRAERERACDDLVLRTGTRGTDYAGHLLAIAREGRPGGPFAAAALAMARPSELEGRLLAILDSRRCREVATRGVVTATACGTALLVCTIAALELEARAVAPGLEIESAVAQLPAAPAPQPPAPARRDAQVPPGEALGAGLRAHGQKADARRPQPQAVALQFQRPAGGAVNGGVAAGVEGGVVGGVEGGIAGGVQGGVASGSGAGQGSAEGQGSAAGQGSGAGRGSGPSQRTRTLSAAEREKVAQALAAALNDENPQVREHALEALARLRSPKAFDPLVTALSDKNPNIRQHAAFALGQLEDPRAIPPLTRAAADSDAEVRQAAISALGELEAADAVPVLTAALKDRDPEVRQQAAFALGQVAAAAAAPALTAALKDVDAEVRQQVAFALGQLRALEAVPALSAALQDANEEVRQQVAFALGQIGDPAALEALTRALKDASAAVREQAAHALGQLADRADEQDEQADEEEQPPPAPGPAPKAQPQPPRQ